MATGITIGSRYRGTGVLFGARSGALTAGKQYRLELHNAARQTHVQVQAGRSVPVGQGKSDGRIEHYQLYDLHARQHGRLQRMGTYGQRR